MHINLYQQLRKEFKCSTQFASENSQEQMEALKTSCKSNNFGSKMLADYLFKKIENAEKDLAMICNLKREVQKVESSTDLESINEKLGKIFYFQSTVEKLQDQVDQMRLDNFRQHLKKVSN